MNIIKKFLAGMLRDTAAKYHPDARLGMSNASPDPFKQFADWYEMAQEVDPDFANAVTLSTATPDGRPSSRLVLLKKFDHEGFVFYTNYMSRKANELDENPWVSLVFWWKELYRQVRIEGQVQKISAHESDEYFHSRGRGSRIGAWASKQSSVLRNRVELEKKVEEFTMKFKEGEIPRPPFWGGYRLVPENLEFWQGRNDRLHDRICYTRIADQDTGEKLWQMQRLSP